MLQKTKKTTTKHSLLIGPPSASPFLFYFLTLPVSLPIRGGEDSPRRNTLGHNTHTPDNQVSKSTPGRVNIVVRKSIPYPSIPLFKLRLHHIGATGFFSSTPKFVAEAPPPQHPRRFPRETKQKKRKEQPNRKGRAPRTITVGPGAAGVATILLHQVPALRPRESRRPLLRLAEAWPRFFGRTRAINLGPGLGLCTGLRTIHPCLPCRRSSLGHQALPRQTRDGESKQTIKKRQEKNV